MTGLDTNVLLRYLLRDEPAQAARADREFGSGGRFLIDGIVLCEVVWALEVGYGLSRRDVVATLERVLATSQFEIESRDLAIAALDDFRRSTTADFSDCLIGRRNRAGGAEETVTFDRSLKGIPGFRLL